MKTTLRSFSIITTIFLITSCAHVPKAPTVSLTMPPKPNTNNQMALAIYDQLPIYLEAAKTPWGSIQPSVPLKTGSLSVYSPEIRKRLIALHDLLPEHNSDSIRMDATTTRAVSLFQFQNDLPRTGVIDQATMDALNIPPAKRFDQMVNSMNQWASYPQNSSSRYVQVNIPSYTMRLISQGEQVMTMRVVVGRPSRPTPTLKSTITTIVFNPTWNVPKTILKNDVIPGMQKNPNYMKEHYNMHVYKTWEKDSAEVDPSSIDWQNATLSNFRYRVTAPPSDVNPLGRVKFLFANEHDVYMHGTPEKSLFELTNRARSSGCIRLEDPMALVRYFYADNSDLNESLTQQYLSTFDTKYIQLRNPMPVYLTYILVTVDQNGTLHFWKNIYS